MTSDAMPVLETKATEAEATNEVYRLMNMFEEFKASNDQRLREIERKGSPTS